MATLIYYCLTYGLLFCLFVKTYCCLFLLLNCYCSYLFLSTYIQKIQKKIRRVLLLYCTDVFLYTNNNYKNSNYDNIENIAKYKKIQQRGTLQHPNVSRIYFLYIEVFYINFLLLFIFFINCCCLVLQKLLLSALTLLFFVIFFLLINIITHKV